MHMLYSDISRWTVTITNVFIIIGLYHQASNIWKTKSAKDFTWTLILALVINEAAWLNYGIAIAEWPITLFSLLSFPAILSAGVGFLKYGRSKGESGSCEDSK